MTFLAPCGADRRGNVTLDGDIADVVLVRGSSISGATSLREQDDIVYDPNDPNLATNPERIFKLYFTAVIGGVSFVYVAFAADGSTFGTPVACTMGATNAGREDPSVATMLSASGQVYRDVNGKMFLYCENKANNDVYGFESTDGITFTELTGNPVIPRATGWESTLTGSPIARHDGTRFIIGYEGISGVAPNPEQFGVAHGTTANSLTKLAANPVWRVEDPLVHNSIVVDAFFRNDAGDRIILLAHDGLGDGTTTMFRGSTTKLDPVTWVNGDIVSEGTGNVSTVRNDFTVDNANRRVRAGLVRAVTAPVDDGTLVARHFYVAAPKPSTVKMKSGGTFNARTLRRRVGGVWVTA